MFRKASVFLAILVFTARGSEQQPETTSRTAHKIDHQPTAKSGTASKENAKRKLAPKTLKVGGAKGYGDPCSPDGKCADGMTCVKYYGVAGPSGPEFSSCEVKCGLKKKCPSGTTCRTIHDGPGSVCR